MIGILSNRINAKVGGLRERIYEKKISESNNILISLEFSMILNYLDFMGSSKKNLKKLDSVKEDSLYHRR